MQALPHLGKRGNVYQWRRRFARQSTGIVDLKLSLGTTDIKTAHILSRKISAESGIVMDQVVERQITPDEARKWLARVVKQERAKIEKLQMLRRFDARDPEDDARHDSATNAAWQHVATAGFRAKLPVDAKNAHLLETHLDVIRADLSSEVRARIVAKDFCELTGRDSVSAMEIITLMNLLIDGKAAAWKRHGSVLSPIATIADQMLDADPGFLGDEPETLLTDAVSANKQQASNEQQVSMANCSAPLVPSVLPAQSMHKNDNMADIPLASGGSGLDPSISAIVLRMNEIKRAEKIAEKNTRLRCQPRNL